MFNHDILLIDIEATGLDPKRHEIIQLGAILLDKNTLKEKKSFSTYIKSTRWKNRDPEAMAVNNIGAELLKNAPGIKLVLKNFNSAFPKNVTIAYYGGPIDMDFMRASFKQARIPYHFDYHYFNLWPVFYTYFAIKKQLKNKKKFTGFTLEDAVKHFKIKPLGTRHDALADCRIEAEILRRIVKEMTKFK